VEGSDGRGEAEELSKIGPARDAFSPSTCLQPEIGLDHVAYCNFFSEHTHSRCSQKFFPDQPAEKRRLHGVTGANLRQLIEYRPVSPFPPLRREGRAILLQQLVADGFIETRTATETCRQS